LLAAYALWTLVSLLWTPNAESSFDEFNRVALYLGIFVLVTLVASRLTVERWADGLAIGLAAVALVALVSRLFPGSFPEGDLPTFLPGAVTRLSFPLGYWNGLAIFLGLGVPLLLRVALVAREEVVRGAALAPMPVIAAAIYLTSSRGGVVSVLVATTVFVALSDRVWSALGALAVSALGGAAAVAVLLGRDELVNGPLGTDTVESQGRSAALLIALACLATGVLYVLGRRLLEGRFQLPAVPWRWVALAAAVAVFVAVVAADPVARFDEFKALPIGATAVGRGDFVRQHLLSGGGSGRWQFWTAALDEWREFPVGGEGAGAFGAWWSEHASFTYSVRDAHSLYVEALGELGVIGLALVVALAVAGAWIGVTRARRASGDARVTAAALGAVFIACVVAAGIDWIWELTAVTVVAIVTLALTCTWGPAERPTLRVVDEDERSRRIGWGFGAGAAVVLAGWGLIVAQAIPLLAQWELGDSRHAVERGDLAGALTAARSARDIQPWASTPYLQLALVREEAGDLAAAEASIEDAIDRAPRDWRLWLVAARIETKQGDVASAERSLRRAADLNPRSPLFAGLG
jgi:hypothetical protein